MTEKYTLDNLNIDNVDVLKQTYIDYMGNLYPIGEPWRKNYKNSERGRQQIVDELPQVQVNAIMIVWGDTPKITEKTE